MPGPILETLTHTVDRLTAAGIEATVDPRDLNLPAVWVTIDRLDLNRLSGDAATVTIGLTAIAPDSGNPTALTDLDDLVAAVDAEFAGRSWDPRAVMLPSQSTTPLPALYTTITLEWSKS